MGNAKGNIAIHTAGPWHAEGNHIVAGSVRVAVVDTPRIHGGVDEEEAAANVRLIEAAPRLLGALQLLCCKGIQSYSKWDEARAAIAAATGGTA